MAVIVYMSKLGTFFSDLAYYGLRVVHVQTVNNTCVTKWLGLAEICGWSRAVKKHKTF